MANGHGGARQNAGRLSKQQEIDVKQKLIVDLDLAHDKLREGIQAGESWAIKLFFEYFYGKPNMKIEHSGDLGIMWNETKTYDTDKKTN